MPGSSRMEVAGMPAWMAACARCLRKSDDFAGDVCVDGVVLHRAGFALHVHEDDRQALPGGEGEHLGVFAAGGDVVEDGRPGVDGGLGHVAERGIHGDRDIGLSADRLDYGADAGDLLLGAMRAAPGRVDSPPISSRSAPSAIIRLAWVRAASRSANWPPSEKLSGVTLRIPITSGRGEIPGARYGTAKHSLRWAILDGDNRRRSMALIQAIDLPFRTAAMIAAVIACVGMVVLLWRRRALGGWAAGLLCVALGLITLAAGGLRVGLAGDAKVLVLVDESASTRGARYREEAFLRGRIAELLGPTRFEIRRFGESGGRTVLPELGASPVLLFSDGQFALPEGGPAVYAVTDPELDGPGDAQVVEIHPERGEAIAVLANGGGTRQVLLDGRPAELPQGRYRIALGDATRPHRVEMSAGDRWPENDRMDSLGEAPGQLELWNAGLPGVTGFRPVAVADLPGEAEGYLRLCDAGG